MAMKAYPSSFLLLWTFAAAVLNLHQVDAVETKDIWHRYKMSVTIQNELPGVLNIHCKSAQDDLGFQSVQPRGAPFSFSFHSNFWGTTRFWCSFDSGSLWNEFDVWADHEFWGKKKRLCDERCVWIARIDAVYCAEQGSSPWLFIHGGNGRGNHKSNVDNTAAGCRDHGNSLVEI